MIPRWPVPATRRTARVRRVAAVTVTALAAALLPPLAARADTPPAPPSDAKLAKTAARHDLTREQFYFVLPDRFANGDAGNDRGGLTGTRLTTGYDPTDKGFYQGGDLKGLTERLDYIKGLGTTSIWMAPIFKNQPVQGTGKDASAGYHGYWITDFTQVDPHFGTNKDLKNLISKAHAKGMKVFFDVITNHTADVVDYEEKSYDYLSKGAFPYLTKDGQPFDDADYADGERRFPAWTPAPSRAPRRSRPPRRTSRSPPGSTTRRCTTTGATPPGPASPPPTATSTASTTCGPSVPRSSAAWRRSTSGGSRTSPSTASGSTP